MNVSTTELAIRNSEENRASAHTLPEHRYPGDAAPGINHARHSLSMIATGYHQLNTAMHCIAGFTQLLLEDHYSSCDRIHEFLEIVHEQSQHLMDIIKSILDIASMSSDQTTFRWQIIPTLEIVKSAAMESQGIAEAKGIALKTALPENLPDIIADKEKLRQAIKNILVTAVTFSSHSSSIDVTARQEGQGLLVEI
jgi:signal transduction histidine kinase